MNKRIRELVKRAGFKTDEANLSFGNYVQDKEYFYADDFIEDELKKFAELLVRECIDTVLDSSVEYATRPQIAEELKEHFGVEE